MSELPHAFGTPQASGLIRFQPEDFFVREELGFTPGDGGEHVWLLIRKRGWNTADLALWLARAAKLPLRAVGYSGLKDRQAVTEQWFSLHLPGKADPQWPDWPDGVELLHSVRHTRKLNRGTHRYNFFALTVRELSAATDLPERLAQVAARGVPNYFGEQRFGRDLGNWQRGGAWLRGEGEAPRKPQLRSLWLSAVRSGIFNAVLAERVRRDCWDQLLAGDICQPEGSRGLFFAREDDQATVRVASGEVNPTAPMPGNGGLVAEQDAATLEAGVLVAFNAEIAALCAEGLDAARRSTRLRVRDLSWRLDGQQLQLEFRLPAGAFATSVLAELLTTRLPQRGSD